MLNPTMNLPDQQNDGSFDAEADSISRMGRRQNDGSFDAEADSISRMGRRRRQKNSRQKRHDGSRSCSRPPPPPKITTSRCIQRTTSLLNVKSSSPISSQTQSNDNAKISVRDYTAEASRKRKRVCIKSNSSTDKDDDDDDDDKKTQKEIKNVRKEERKRTRKAHQERNDLLQTAKLLRENYNKIPLPPPPPPPPLLDILGDHRSHIWSFLQYNAPNILIDSIEENPYSKVATPLYERFFEAWQTVNNPKIVLGFHGTLEDNIWSICEYGFDPTRRGACGQKLGPGEYFGKNASASLSYCKGGRKMLVVALLVDPSGLTADQDDVLVIHKVEHQLPLFVINFSEMTYTDMGVASNPMGTSAVLNNKAHIPFFPTQRIARAHPPIPQLQQYCFGYSNVHSPPPPPPPYSHGFIQPPAPPQQFIYGFVPPLLPQPYSYGFVQPPAPPQQQFVYGYVPPPPPRPPPPPQPYSYRSGYGQGSAYSYGQLSSFQTLHINTYAFSGPYAPYP